MKDNTDALMQSVMSSIVDVFNSGVADMTEEECFATDGATLANDLIIAAHERTLDIDDAVNTVLSYMDLDENFRRAYLHGLLSALLIDRIGGAA